MQSFVICVVWFIGCSAISNMMSYIFGTLQKYPNFMVPLNFVLSLIMAITMAYLI